MSSRLNKIKEHMFLSVDFERNKSEGGIELPGHSFYLVSSVSFFLKFMSGEREIAKINTRVPIKIDDAKLRQSLGARATDAHVQKKYKIYIDRMAQKIDKAIEIATNKSEVAGKQVKEVQLILL